MIVGEVRDVPDRRLSKRTVTTQNQRLVDPLWGRNRLSVKCSRCGRYTTDYERTSYGILEGNSLCVVSLWLCRTPPLVGGVVAASCLEQYDAQKDS